MSREDNIYELLQSIKKEVQSLKEMLLPALQPPPSRGVTVYLGAAHLNDQSHVYVSHVVVPGRQPLLFKGARRGTADDALLTALRLTIDSLNLFPETAQGIRVRVVGQADFHDALGMACLEDTTTPLAQECAALLALLSHGASRHVTVELLQCDVYVDQLLVTLQTELRPAA